MNRVNFSPPYLGSGWAFPVHESGGATATAAYEQHVGEAIRIILGTEPGERVMRPDFGAGLGAFVFEPINATTLETLRKRVSEALIDWEPRIDLQEVRVTAAAEDGKLLVEVSYRVRATNSHQNLVYPFYLEEGTQR